MSFFASGGGKSSLPQHKGAPSLELLHRLECRACPLANPKLDGKPWKNYNPNIPAAGSDRPIIYILGEAPGAAEDKERGHFIGKSGQYLRQFIPRDWLADLRWNNVVRTRPPDNRTPEFMEIEACRPSVLRDIEASRPKAIFGFGAIPLDWATGNTGIANWRGRRLPVRIGDHECWYYSFVHPAAIIRAREEQEKRMGRSLRDADVGGEDDRTFRFDIERAFAEVESLPDAKVMTRQEALAGVEWVSTFGAGAIRQIADFLEWAKRQKVVGVDYETNMTRPYANAAKVLSMGVGTESRSFAFPYRHSRARWSESELDEIRRLWVDFLRAPGVSKAVHNLPFEMEWSAKHFDDWCLLHSDWEDTMTEAAILDERTGRGESRRGNEQGPLSLDFLVRQYFGLALKELSSLDRKNLDNEPLDLVLRYNAMDAKFHCMLHEVQIKRIGDHGMMPVYDSDLSALPALTRLQLKGLPRNAARIEELSRKYTDELARLADKMSRYPQVLEFKKRTRTDFSPSNNTDVTMIVRDIMGRREGMKGEGGSYSVEEDVLKKIDHPLTNDILAYRKVAKVKSTYNDGLRDGGAYVHDDGMLHPQINATVARTGRTSMEDPNGQNWPKRDEGQKEVRSQVEAPPGHVIVAIDYGQIQARNIAMESKDPVFVKALWERYDIHMEWAERLAYAYPERIGGCDKIKDKKAMKDWRQVVKNGWTFPLFFGSVVNSVADNLDIPLDYVKPEFNEFWRTFSGVKSWQDRIIADYKKTGYVQGLSGRRRHAPLTTNQIINSPIQADEAYIVKDAMARVVRSEDDWDSQPVLLIHDDLTFIMPSAGLEDRLERIIGCMLDVKHIPWINVPITLEVSVGKDWEHLSEAGDFSSDLWWGK